MGNMTHAIFIVEDEYKKKTNIVGNELFKETGFELDE